MARILIQIPQILSNSHIIAPVWHMYSIISFLSCALIEFVIDVSLSQGISSRFPSHFLIYIDTIYVSVAAYLESLIFYYEIPFTFKLSQILLPLLPLIDIWSRCFANFSLRKNEPMPSDLLYIIPMCRAFTAAFQMNYKAETSILISVVSVIGIFVSVSRTLLLAFKSKSARDRLITACYPLLATLGCFFDMIIAKGYNQTLELPLFPVIFYLSVVNTIASLQIIQILERPASHCLILCVTWIPCIIAIFFCDENHLSQAFLGLFIIALGTFIYFYVGFGGALLKVTKN